VCTLTIGRKKRLWAADPREDSRELSLSSNSRRESGQRRVRFEKCSQRLAWRHDARDSARVRSSRCSFSHGSRGSHASRGYADAALVENQRHDGELYSEWTRRI